MRSFQYRSVLDSRMTCTSPKLKNSQHELLGLKEVPSRASLHMAGGSTGERPFTNIITSYRYWIIHSITIPSLFASGFLFILTGLAYDLFGTPRPKDYYTEERRVRGPVLLNRKSIRSDLEMILRAEEDQEEKDKTGAAAS